MWYLACYRRMGLVRSVALAEKGMVMVQAVVMPAPHQPLELRSFAEPELEAGAVLLRTLGSEVCGTDVHLWHGRLAGVPYPIIPGHVSVGEVAAIGGQARDVDGRALNVGDVVTFLDVET